MDDGIRVIALILGGSITTTLLFLLAGKLCSTQKLKGTIVNVVMNHRYSNFVFIGLWVFSLLSYQSRTMFEYGQWPIEELSDALFLFAIYYSIDLSLRYSYYLFIKTITSNDHLKNAYKRLHRTIRVVALVNIIFYTVSSPNFFHQLFFSGEVWLWISYFFKTITASVFAISLVNFFDNLYTTFYKKDKNQALLTRALSRPIVFLFSAYLTKISAIFFVLSPKIEKNLDSLYTIFIILSGAYFFYCMVKLLTILAFRYSKRSNKIINVSIINLVSMATRLLIVLTSFLLIAQKLTGQKLEGIIAAMGIGGVAFALASQDLLKNLLAGVTIMLDKPFTLGQSISALDFEGSVEEIGFRSTLIRTAQGLLVTMPNSKLADSPIKNNTEKNFLRRTINLGLSYDNSADTIELALRIIETILLGYVEQLNQKATVIFNEITTYTFNIMVTYDYTNYKNLSAFNQFNQRVFLEILREFNLNNIKLALPTQMVYLEHS